MSESVDEKRWGAINSAADATTEIGADASFEPSFFQCLTECRGGEVQLARKFQKKLGTHLLLVFEEQIVHLPELSISSGKLRSLGGRFGVRFSPVALKD